MQSWHLHISGQVQGVGFRPYVYRMAVAAGLQGWVNNANDGVHVCFNADVALAERFAQDLLAQAPTIAHITADCLEPMPWQDFENFRIVHSQSEGDTKLLLSPDFGLCADCRADIMSKANRRKDYAFTTCTYCGPRFSIVRGLPYDRPLTTMHPFNQCPTCQDEYDNPTDRRYYSQTNSCADCGIALALYTATGERIAGEQSELLDQVVEYWRAGKIVAIKGIGGYLLTCAATDGEVIKQLRTRKHRPIKPLAVMFPDASMLANYADLNDKVANALNGPVSPIVLLSLRADAPTDLAKGELAPGLSKLGIMLPYTPLYALLMARYAAPIVATSGNRSGQPIIYEDATALSDLADLADYVLSNNREIVVPQDDSVMQWTPDANQPIILRRSRGLAPTFRNRRRWTGNDILAMGADKKNTFALLHQRQVYLSPYLGDLVDLAAQANQRKLLTHLQQTLQARPEVVLVDKHPQYATTQLGQEKATVEGLDLIKVPHHEAHFTAILGEHELIKSSTSVLGVIWDGTGLGEDGQIWGGELFEYQDKQITHLAQLDYFASPLGDKLAREPRLCAWSLLASAEVDTSLLAPAFTAKEYAFYEQFFARPARLQTSSMGRLFDGIAAILGLSWRQSHEAEAAMLLEHCAQTYIDAHGIGTPLESYVNWSDEESWNFPTKQFIKALVADLPAGANSGLIAARCHRTLIAWVEAVAKRCGYTKIAFSGGVWQNSLLVDLCIHYLATDFELYFHEQLSPNDENIAFGQLVWYDIQQSTVTTKTTEHVFSHTR